MTTTHQNTHEAPVRTISVDSLHQAENQDSYIFVDSLLQHAPWQIARILMQTCRDDFNRMCTNVKAIKNCVEESFFIEVANHTFGQKLAGDLGIRSTQGHPKTDYGEPRLGGGWDIDTK